MSDPRTPGDAPLEVCLTLPALADHARVARLAMAGMATRNGLSYDEVEDLRIAVGEVFALLVRHPDPTARIRLRCRVTDDEVGIEADRTPAVALDPVDGLTTAILGAVVDEATIDGPAARVVLVKRSEHPR